MVDPSTQLWVVFIQDDAHDVTQGPAEPYAQAVKRMGDATAGGRRLHKVWMEEVKS